MDIDINILRSAVTLFSFALFIGLMTWVWWPARKSAMNDAAQLPFDGEVPLTREPERRAAPSRAPSPRGMGRGTPRTRG
jgi:cytochrome c oxidase cbb3-type subunit 4